MDKFLELVAEEIEFNANEILKDMQNKKRIPAHPTHCPVEMCWSFPDQEKSSVKVMIYKVTIFKLSFKSMVRLLLFMASTNEDLNMKAKKARTFLYFLFLTEYRYTGTYSKHFLIRRVLLTGQKLRNLKDHHPHQHPDCLSTYEVGFFLAIS